MIVGAPHCGFSPVHVLGNQQFIEIQLNQLKIYKIQPLTSNVTTFLHTVRPSHKLLFG